jgi:hypothetical protein
MSDKFSGETPSAGGEKRDVMAIFPPQIPRRVA